MKMHRAFFVLPVVGAVVALGSGLERKGADALQQEYSEEQNKIDLALTEFALQSADGSIPGEEAQDRIDRWLHDNASRLTAQAERAAELDLRLPLTEESESSFRSDRVEDTPENRRLAELKATEQTKESELRARAETAEEYQDLYDQWFHSDEGKGVFSERHKLLSRLPGRQPLGSQPAVLEIAENPRPQETGIFEAEKRLARRLQQIRRRHPDATAEKMQDLIDLEKDAVDFDMRAIGKFSKEIRREALVRDVASLRAKITPPKRNPSAPK